MDPPVDPVADSGGDGSDGVDPDGSEGLDLDDVEHQLADVESALGHLDESTTERPEHPATGREDDR